MNPHTKFGIPTSNDIGDMLDTIILETRVIGQGHIDPKMVCDISPSKDASIHQIWDSYLE